MSSLFPFPAESAALIPREVSEAFFPCATPDGTDEPDDREGSIIGVKGTEVRTDVVEAMLSGEQTSGACCCAWSTSIVLKVNFCGRSSLPKSTASITALLPLPIPCHAPCHAPFHALRSADGGREIPNENPFPAATWMSFSSARSTSSTGSSDASNDPTPSSPQ